MRAWRVSLGTPTRGVGEAEPDFLRGGPHVALRPEHDEHIVVHPDAGALADAIEHQVPSLELRKERAGEHNRRVVQAGDHPDAPGQFVEEGGVGLGGVLGETRHAGDADREHSSARLERAANEAEVHAGPEVRDVAGVDADRVGRREAAAVQLVTQFQQVVLADTLVVNQFHRQPGPGHALDLDAAAAADRHVHVLAAGADPGPHAARQSRRHAAEQDRLPHLVRRAQLGGGSGQSSSKAYLMKPLFS